MAYKRQQNLCTIFYNCKRSKLNDQLESERIYIRDLLSVSH